MLIEMMYLMGHLAETVDTIGETIGIYDFVEDAIDNMAEQKETRKEVKQEIYELLQLEEGDEIDIISYVEDKEFVCELHIWNHGNLEMFATTCETNIYYDEDTIDQLYELCEEIAPVGDNWYWTRNNNVRVRFGDDNYVYIHDYMENVLADLGFNVRID